MGLGRGTSQRTSHWLTIPLCVAHHYIGPEAIDGEIGVPTWEARYGTQMAHLEIISERVGFNVFERAKLAA
jgi:hypothetical protein